ncbi:SMI1/KNR4 family protein [Catenulispora subtropica]|uniref:SMI1/KNR4 family protein n=1 Tax=Catenulispora subtropica TaxID=450798 RepID=A0ABN2SWF9_9ACTN
MTIEDDDDLVLPAALAAIAALGFPEAGEDDEDEDDHPTVDFEPFEEFLDAEDTTDWFRTWTANPETTGDQFRVFGQTSAGGYAAFWLVRDDAPLTDQPIVFLGPEGETGVVACDLSGFLWLVADGSGPYEAVEYPTRRSRPHPEFTAIAEKHATGERMTAREVVAAARDEFPDFEDTMAELAR